MNASIGIAIGAGIASALLFTVVTAGSALAVLLYIAAPLPILIAALGWTRKTGLIAALIASVSVALVLSARAGMVFAVGVALPAWWFAHLALLSRETEDDVEWYPLGRVLAAVALTSAALTVFGMVLVGGDYASLVAVFETAVESFRSRNAEVFAQLGASGVETSEIARLMALVAPSISAAIGVLTSSVLLWIAGRLVLMSGRLPRPWPDLASVAIPTTVLVVFAATALASFLPDGMPALAARTTAAALAMAYALQGLSTIHAISRGFSARGLLLGALYTVLIVMPGWPVLALAAIGVAEGFFNFRGRVPALPPTATPGV